MRSTHGRRHVMSSDDVAAYYAKETERMASEATYGTLLATLERHMRETKQAYYAGVRGYTYDDMAKAAERVLRMRAAIEKATGRPVRTKVTQRAIADLLR